MDEQTAPAKEAVKLRVNLIGWIFGVVGIVVAVTLWYFPHEERARPTYLIDPSRTSIVRATSGLSALKVYYNDQQVSGNDVNALTLYFWNSSGRALQVSAVKSPYLCRFANGVDILEVHVARLTRDVTRLSAIKLDNTSLQMTFDFLEKGDGAAIQVIYSGPITSKLTCGGVAVDALPPEMREPQTEESVRKFLSFGDVHLNGSWTWIAPALLSLIYTLSVALLLVRYAKRHFFRRPIVIVGLLAVSSMWFITGLSFVRYHQTVQYVVPDLLRQTNSPN